MTPDALIAELSRRDIRLSAVGDRLKIDAPKGALTPELRILLTERKEEILRLHSSAGVTPFGGAELVQDDESATNPKADPFADPAVLAARRRAADLGVLGHVVPVPIPKPVAAWITGDALAGLPEDVQGIVCERDGWSPSGWAEYLIIRAERCDSFHADLAERYRKAASLILHGVKVPKRVATS